jgi:hypothetical protein
MKEPLEIITEIRSFISTQNPIRFPHQETILVNFLNELEVTLSPIEEVIIEEPIVEVVEETVVEEVVVEEPVTEEPIVEVVAPKKTTTRKK